MVELTTKVAAADAATLLRLGAASWLRPPTVLACANLPAARQMVEWLDTSDGDAVCVLTPAEDGYRRFSVYPGSVDLKGDLHEAMTAAGHNGAMVAANVLPPSGRGVPSTAEVKRLRWLPVTFTVRPGEDLEAATARVSGGGYREMVGSEAINPPVLHDTIRDKLHILVPAAIDLFDEDDRASATDLMWRLSHSLGGDPLSDPLPGIVPLAGSIGVDAVGVPAGQVIAFLCNPNAPQPGRLAGSSLADLERFVARREAHRGGLIGV